MHVPIEWLKTYVPVRIKPEALAKQLTMAGLEVISLVDVDGQPVLDIEVTPNRADCLSIIGIAREVAAITGQRLQLPGAGGGRRGAGETKSPRPLPHTPCPTIRIEDHTGCQRYLGRLIEGVRIGPSPGWMQRRLLACGVRPINNVVDITNYVLVEYGQPLHAFDYGHLTDGTIVVRRAKAQEPITTLDGVSRRLPTEALVIADAQQPVAVAGVMGGVGSEVTERTHAVLLESALFDPITVRRTARALGLASESSYRFERGVDPEGIETASVRAAALIAELVGGTVSAVRDVGTKPAARRPITLQVERLNRWLGTRIAPAEVRTGLARLACRVATSGTGTTLHVSAPSFRRDVVQDVDLYEEIARTIGYDRIPSTLPVAPLACGSSPEGRSYRHLQSLRCLCASLGLAEAMTWSLLSETDLARCGWPAAEAIRLSNPLSQEHVYLRPTLLVGLLRAVRRNATQGVENIRFFEVGRLFKPGPGHAPLEEPWLGVALSGAWQRDWAVQQPADLFHVKGVLQALASRLCEGSLQFVSTPQAWAEPAQSAAVELSGQTIGAAGQVSRALAAAFDLEGPVWIAEVSVEGLLAARRRRLRAQSPPTFPPVKRDLSVLVSDDTSFESVDRAIRETGAPHAARVELIDSFRGERLPAGQHSLTFSLEYRDPTRTLTALEVDAIHQRIVQALASRFGAKLR